MKLRNKKTGEILEIDDFCFPHSANPKWIHSLEELNEDWEDAEEPKGWCVTMYGGISRITKDDEILIPNLKEIGNYFETEEEAEKAFEKLKAWKRLKDNGFKISHWFSVAEGYLNVSIRFNKYAGILKDDKKDLDLLFGGEE